MDGGRHIGSSSDDAGTPNSRRRFLFKVGIALMAVSFLVYPSYLVIPVLPVSTGMKGFLFVAASVLSWSIFGIGTVIAGKEGYPYLKEAAKRYFKRSG